MPARLAARLHRGLGRGLMVAAGVVALACVTGLAGSATSGRVLVHATAGSLVFALLAVKLLLLRVLELGGRALPFIGTAVFLNFWVIWVTSVSD